MMQSIAIENNFSETAFLVPEQASQENRVTRTNRAGQTARTARTAPRYSLRWFTPGGEIDLCGHATLASAFVVGKFLNPEAASVAFDTKSGELTASIGGDKVSMSMPAYQVKQVAVTDAMQRAFGVRPIEAWMARDLICILPNETDVRNIDPDAQALAALDGEIQVATARADKGTGFDCVSRCFAPKLDVLEDPVTGSSHCALAPLWGQKLGKSRIRGFQASKRTGILECSVEGDRVQIAGPAVLYSKAELNVPSA